MDRVRYLLLSDNSPKTDLIEQHILILDAIKKGDLAAAQESVRYHLSEIISSLPGVAMANKDLFE